jgi:hypothetical protein
LPSGLAQQRSFFALQAIPREAKKPGAGMAAAGAAGIAGTTGTCARSEASSRSRPQAVSSAQKHFIDCPQQRRQGAEDCRRISRFSGSTRQEQAKSGIIGILAMLAAWWSENYVDVGRLSHRAER